jgi:NADPH:quinone reductase-like Zn-dependent oxidoreductase
MAAQTPPASVTGHQPSIPAAAMKAIIQHRYGPPDVLALEETATPAVGDGEVLIRVHAAGLNVADGFVMRGVPYILRPLAGLLRPHPGVRGVDVAGTVTDTGAKVAGLRPGDEVFGGTASVFTGGAFATYARAPGGNLVPKPAMLSFEQAAAVPIAAITALRALRDAAGVRPGQQVLINGASGGVGTFAVQIAKAFGAQVTGVCSTGSTGLVRSLGADTVIDYTREDFTTGPRRFDVIVDNVANRPLSHCLRVLARNGTLVPNANTPGRWLGGLGRIIKARLMTPFVPQRIRTCHGIVNQADLLTLTELIEAGKITPVIDRAYPLAQVPEAIRYLEQGHAHGKIVITS